jgi:hypothetical protein
LMKLYFVYFSNGITCYYVSLNCRLLFDFTNFDCRDPNYKDCDIGYIS